MDVAERREFERRIKELEQRVAKLPTRVSSGGGGGTSMLERETKADLPDAVLVAETTMGRITTDNNGELGMVCVVNPTKDGWDAINFFE